MPECVLVPFGYFIVFSFASLIFSDMQTSWKNSNPKISGKPGILIEKILGESGKVRDNRLNSYKNDLFSPLLRDFGNLKSVLIDKILQKTLIKRQNFAILQKNKI